MSRQYDIHRLPVPLVTEIERLRAQVTMGWQQEFLKYQRFGLQDGMKILDLGCGPGFVTANLLAALPSATVTALDPDADLLGYARALMVERRLVDQVTFVQAHVPDLPLPDDSVDFAVARMLFLHLSDPIDAALAIRRVLKPGGRLVIVDIDDGVFGTTHPPLNALPEVLVTIAHLKAARGGNRYIGRELPRILKASQFTDVQIDALVHHSDVHGTDGMRQQFEAQRFAGLLANGAMTPHQYDEVDRFAQLLAREEAYAMMLFFMACGTKPVPGRPIW